MFGSFGAGGPVEIFNLCEGVFWILVGFGFAVSLFRPCYRKAKVLAAVNFVAFGISDFVEVQTGVWWSPLWLPAWKGLCFVIMAAQAVFYFRVVKARRHPDGAPPQE